MVECVVCYFKHEKKEEIGKKKNRKKIFNCKTSLASLWSDKASAPCQMWKSFFVIFLEPLIFQPSKKAVAECRNLDIIHSSHSMCLSFLFFKVPFMPSRVVLEITLFTYLSFFWCCFRLSWFKTFTLLVFLFYGFTLAFLHVSCYSFLFGVSILLCLLFFCCVLNHLSVYNIK